MRSVHVDNLNLYIYILYRHFFFWPCITPLFFYLWRGVQPIGGGGSWRTKCASRIALFSTFDVPSAPLGLPFFHLWVPPIFFRFLSKKLGLPPDFCQKNWKFNFEEKIQKNFVFFFKKNRNFREKNCRFFSDFLSKKGGTPKNFEKHPQKNLGVFKVEKTAILEAHLIRQKWKKGRS